MKVFLKICISDFKNATRNERELSVVTRMVKNIVVLAKGIKNSIEVRKYYSIHRRTTKPLGDIPVIIKLNRLISVFAWAEYARNIHPFCISCHDLVALFIGWLSTWFVPRSRRPLLVYDAHEFEIGRNTDGKRGKLGHYIVPRAEKFLMGKCAFSIMVNDSIADEVQRIHGLKERPIVVRNISSYWQIDQDVCQTRKKKFCELAGMPEDTFIIMYHGAIMAGRGLEVLLASVSMAQDILLVVLGHGEATYIKELKSLSEELGLSESVLFCEAVPIDVLWQYVGAADVGMITIPAISKSYYYMLPNKFFENIQSMTPVIGSNFPEISKIINEYDIGLLVDPDDAGEIAKTIERMRSDKEMYQRFKMNLKRAKEDLCWENESKVLEDAYRKILG